MVEPAGLVAELKPDRIALRLGPGPDPVERRLARCFERVATALDLVGK